MITYKQIIEFGLDEKEARVFLAALELGGESVLAIAKKAGINRVATYDALETLIARGLISTFIKGKRTYYTSVEPDQLELILEKEKVELEARHEKLKTLLPDLNSIYNFSNKKPKVSYYEGKAGLLAIRSTFLKTPDKQLRIIYHYYKFSNVFTKKEQEDYQSKKVKAGIQVKSIAVISDETPAPEERLVNVNRVYLDYKDYPIKSDITIYGNRIAFVSIKELFGIIIENQELADTMKTFFDLAQGVAKKNI